MANKSPNAPATNTSPMTESLAFNPVIPVVDSPEAQSISAEITAEEPDEDSWFGSFFSDDEEEDPQPAIGDQLHLSSKDLPKRWNSAKKAVDPEAARIEIARTHSALPVDEIEEQIDEESGLVPIVVEGAKDAYHGTRNAYHKYTPDVVKPVVDKTIKAGGFLLGNLEYGDVPRSESWALGYLAGSFLPDTDTRFGSALGDVAGKALRYREQFRDLKDFVDGNEFDSESQEDDYYDQVEALGKNIYSAFADSKLYDKAINTKGYFIDRPDWWGVLRGGNATGQDLLDIAFPIDMMKRLEANSPKTRHKNLDPRSSAYMVKHLSDPVSRMGMGLALEVVADPLWFAGPAKATQTVSLAGKVYNLSESGARVAGHLERYSGIVGGSSFHQKRVVTAIVGDTDKANDARAVILDVADNAVEESSAFVNKANHFEVLSNKVRAGESVEDAVLSLRRELEKEIAELSKLADKYSDASKGSRVKADYNAVQKKIAQIQEDIATISGSVDKDKLADALLAKSVGLLDTAVAHRSAASELRSYVDLVRRSKPVDAGLKEATGLPMFGTWHIPFSETTYTIAKRSDIEAAGKYVNQALDKNSFLTAGVRLVKEGAKAASESAILKKVDDARKAGMRGLESLSAGEKLAWLASTIGHPFVRVGQIAGAGVRAAGSKAADWTYQGLDTLAQLIGTRHWQALAASRSLKQEMAFYGARGANQLTLTAADSGLLRLRRLRPELWENYQNSVTNYMKQLAFLQGETSLKINQIYRLAGGKDGKGGALAEWKKKIETEEIPQLDADIARLKEELKNPPFKSFLLTRNPQKIQREIRHKEAIKAERLEVLSDEYGVQEFMQEIHNLVETGAGKLEQNPWLRSTADKLNDLKVQLADNLQIPLEEVEQALVAIARWASGDKQVSAGIADQIFRLRQLSEGAENVPSLSTSQMDQLTDALSVKLKTRSKLLRSVTTNKLAEIIYRTLDIAGETRFGEETAQAIDNALMKALNGDRELADEILQYAAGVYGGSPHSALRLFAADVTGDLQRVADAANSSTIKFTADPTKITPFHPGGVHPNRMADHPEYKGMPADATFEEFVAYIQNQKKEHGAIYDMDNGQQVSSAIGTETTVHIEQNLDWRYVDELTAKGTAVSIHNHPNTPGVQVGAKALEKIGNDILDVANLRHHEQSTHITFSFNDLIAGVALNEKHILVANPDGSLWRIDRPKGGWLRVDDYETQYTQRLRTLTDDGTLEELKGAHSRIVESVGEELNPKISWLEKELEQINEAFSSGVIDKKKRDSLRKLTLQAGSQWILGESQRLINKRLADLYEEVFGSRPYRQVGPGRYSATGPVRKAQSDDSFKVERSLLKNRVKQSIEDFKLKTDAQIEEIRAYRVGSKTREDLIFLQDELLSGIAAKKGEAQYNIEKILFDKFDFDDLDEIPEQAEDLLSEIFIWADTDYPGGRPVFENGKQVSRSVDEWMAQKSETLDMDDFSREEIQSMLDDAIDIKNMDSKLQETLDTLVGAKKVLETRRGEKSLGKVAIRKEAGKLRKQRTDDVLKNLIEDSTSLPDATSRIRQAFDELLDVPNEPFYNKLKDDLAATLADYSFRRKYKFGTALRETREQGRKLVGQELENLKTQLAEEIPALRIPDMEKGITTRVDGVVSFGKGTKGKRRIVVKPQGEKAQEYLIPKGKKIVVKEGDYVRAGDLLTDGRDIVVPLKEWELNLWERMQDLTASLSEEETLLAVYASLAESPKLVNAKTIGEDAYKALKDRYKSLVGRRMGELPEELKPVKEAYQGLIKQYEDLYVKYGMDFVKSPEDMLRFWGVIDYAPHMKPTARKILTGEPLTSEAAIVKYNKDLEQAFGSGMDQRKRRSIVGTIAEINDVAGKTMFSVDPSALLGRYMKAAKTISGQEFMLSLVAGGVIKSFGPKHPYENALEVLANKYRLFQDIELDSVSHEALEAAVRARASSDELRYLDEVSLASGRELVSSSQRAADMQYLPIFERAVPNLSNDLVLGGTKSDWANEGLVPEKILEQFKDAGSKPYVSTDDKFATFIRESRAVREGDEIIASLARIKADQYAKGEELYDPVARQRELYLQELRRFVSLLNKKGKSVDEVRAAVDKKRDLLKERAWDAVSKEMNSLVSKYPELRVPKGQALKGFYAQGAEAWNLYVPAVVKQSMDELFSPKRFADSGLVTGLQKFNNFWKARVTIISTAFHTRNSVSNVFSNMLDSGLATLNPEVAFNAGRLSMLSHIYERYGSVEEARRILSMPRGAKESKLQHNSRKAARKILDEIDTKGAVYDLGDGVGRTADDAIGILRERGVVAGGLQQYVDIGTFESSLADVYVSAGLDRDLEKAKRGLSAIEDGAIVTLSMLISGMPIPVGLPKQIGSFAGRSIENQARISNFIVNTRKTQSFDEAAKRVDKFLFNYGDLTGKQKLWARLFIPFFTWTQKNISLQIRMMKENPVFYSNFSRLLIHQGPELVERYNADLMGIPYVPKRSGSKRSIALRDSHTRNMIKFPVPGHPGYYVEGLGLPQEAFFEEAGKIVDIADIFSGPRFDNKKQQLRFLGQTHALMKLGIEWNAQHSLFFNRPIAENTNGQKVMHWIKGVRRLPYFGDSIGDYLVEAAGIRSAQPFSGKKGMMMDNVYIEGTSNFLLQQLPWSRVLNDATAAAMLYNMTYLDDMPADMREKYLKAEYEPIPAWYKIADALGGIRIIAENEPARIDRINYAIKQRRREAYKRQGLLHLYEKEFMKEQQ